MVHGKVLVATDLTEASEEAIRQAHAWAKAAGVELVACHVVPNVLHNNVLFPQHVQQEALQLIQQERDAENALLDQCSAITGSEGDGDFSIVVNTGSPAASIVDTAEEIKARLIVVGTGARNDQEETGLGSVAERVVRYAHCPVLVARPHAGSEVILVATDFSETSMHAVNKSVEVAKVFGARVVLMHSIDVTPSRLVGLGVPFGAAPVVPPPEALEDMRHNVERMLRDTAESLGIEAAFRVEEGDAPDAIVSAARQLSARMVIIGTAGRTGWRRLALGSVAEEVARSAPCPVLIVRKSHA